MSNSEELIPSQSQFSGGDVVGSSDAGTSAAEFSGNTPAAPTPESLKNTPGNIAKLEDAIENHEGRKKYLARTKSPSDGADVCWYFCKTPLPENQVSASVPQTEVVGQSDYFRFGMRDSLALEASFLQREDDLLAEWWKEYAECSEGPTGFHTSSAMDSKQISSSCSDANVPNKLLSNEEERVGVPIKGGLFEVDLVKRQCFPVYWHGENCRVLRGHWFARKGGREWRPLREDIAEQVEFAYRSQVWHRRSFQPSGLFAARVDIQSSSSGLHALFTGEDDTWEAWLGYGIVSLSNVIGLGGSGFKLRRGYAPSGSAKPSKDELRQQREEEMDDYCSKVPVGHLVFMVHGIGQRLEKNNLVDDVTNFRRVTSHLAESHLTLHQRNIQRVLFIPCQWRKGLKLDGENAVEKITLDGVRSLREVLGAFVHDILYYMSPIYCQDIINSVSNQLNRLYMKFLKRNPGYSGKVSIFGHSLGSVLSYDILCHQDMFSAPFNTDGICSGNSPHDGGIHDDTTLHTICGLTEFTSDAASTRFKHTSGKWVSSDDPSNCEENVEVCGIAGSTTLLNETTHSSDLEVIDGQSHAPGTAAGQAIEAGKPGELLIHEIGRVDQDGQLRSADGDTRNDVLGQMNEKDKLIDMLRKEVSTLKAAIEDSRENKRSAGANGEMVNMNFALYNQDGLRKISTPLIKYTKLNFKTDTFFCVGSPLGVFLSLRNVRIGKGEGQAYWEGEGVSEEMPACRRMLNIFHPFDPVAYRIEPLVCKEYISKRPILIPYHKGGKRLHVGVQEFKEGLAAQSQAVATHINSMKTQVINTFYKTKQLLEDATDEPLDAESRTYGSLMIERLTGSDEGRIDYMLQDATFQHPLISAIQSHTAYWCDYDTGLFVLKHLYRDIPAESPQNEGPDVLLVPEVQTNTKHPHAQSAANAKIDVEDGPLTFSDKYAIKQLTESMKKVVS